MTFFINTDVMDKEGRVLAANVDFMNALDYIRVCRLDVEYTVNKNSATLTFKGKSQGRSIQATITDTKKSANGQGGRLYDIAPRVYWHGKNIAKGLQLNFIELLGYIKVHRHEIVKKERGNYDINVIVFYGNFNMNGYRRNRIEATVTRLEEEHKQHSEHATTAQAGAGAV